MRCDGEHRQVGRSVGGLTTKNTHDRKYRKNATWFFAWQADKWTTPKEGYEIIKRNQFRMKYLLADKAYDTDKIRQKLFDIWDENMYPTEM